MQHKDLENAGSLNGFRTVEVLRIWTRPDGVFRIGLTIEPYIVVCISRQPLHEPLVCTSLRFAYPHPRGRTTLVTIYTIVSPRARTEGIEYPKPCADSLRPPYGLKDLVIHVQPCGSLFVTRHPSICELFQEIPMRSKRRV